MSPVIQSLIANGLFDRLPPTFSTFFFEQFKDWEALFPAERNYFERLFTLIDRLPNDDSEALFGSLRVVEQKMGVNEKTWPRRTFTLDQVDFLNRNPHYSEWRRVITNIFNRIDPVLEQELAKQGRPRLAIVLSPAELPVDPDRMWTKLKGRRITLDAPIEAEKHVAPLFSSGKSRPYERWIIQSDATVPPVQNATMLSYDALAAYRKRLMTEVQQVVEKEQLRGPRELGARLKKMKALANESGTANDPIMAEFTRAVLLAGNGTLLLNNTFVEWATVQAVRRARPTMVAVSFGIRNKMKPFSSLLIYADQEKSNPIPSQMDILGSYVDLEIFYQYIWQEFEKYIEYRNNTVYLFAALGMDELLVIAPRDFEIPSQTSPQKLMDAAREWIG